MRGTWDGNPVLILHPAHLVYVGLHIATLLAAVTLPSALHLGAFLVVSWTTFLLARLLYMGPISEVDAVFVLWLAASQNVLIGALVEGMSADHVRLLIGSNFMLGAMWVTALGLQRVQAMLRRSTVWVLLVVPAVTLLVVSSIAVFGFNGLAAVASARNILTPPLFFVLGWLIGCGRRGARDQFMKAVLWLGLLVIFFGLVERFMTPNVWNELNIGALWTKKGLTNISLSGLPRNFWSAERIAGAPVRRMVSTFGDPINLGTFLMLTMLCAYGLKRPLVVLLAGVAIALTVSKGGALGCLVFAVVYSYYRWSRVGFLITGLTAVAVGASFIAYSARYATRSLFVHLGGAAFALLGLREYPLGRGMGRAGTMAQQFVDLGDQQILESGLGMIVGQLGFPGFVVFGVFLGLVYKGALGSRGVRERIVAVSLFWSITLNMFFNEVALSPNSAAGYFILLGLIVAQAKAPRLVTSPGDSVSAVSV